MQRTYAVLRQVSAEKGMKGGAEDRDLAISRFLSELSLLFTPLMISRLDDETVGGMFEDWLRAIPHLSQEERIDALVRDVRLCSVPFLVYRKGLKKTEPEEPPSENVVALHPR